MTCENCKKIIKEYEAYLDDYKKEQRELVKQEVLELIDKVATKRNKWGKLKEQLK